MNTIKVFHTIRYFLTYFIGCSAFVALGFWIIHSHHEGLAQIAGWASIFFFGLGVLVMITGFINEQLLHKPYLVISEDGLTVCSLTKQTKHLFSEISSFELYDMKIGKSIKYLSIVYRKEVEANIPSIAVSGLTMEPQIICDKLNAILKKE